MNLHLDLVTPSRIWRWRLQGVLLCLLAELLLGIAYKAYEFLMALAALGQFG